MWIKRISICVLAFLMLATAYNLYPETPLPPGSVVDHLVVSKTNHTMRAYGGGVLLKTYTISIGRGAWGMHDRESNITPTGSYSVSKMAVSSFHKALPISYGDEIEIHGLHNHLGFIGKFQRVIDWTRGCIALTDPEIDELYTAVATTTTIEISE